MKNPFFSVIIPTYNRAYFLKIAIDSVLAQTFTDYELIVVDDGSQDNTKGLINEINNAKIKYICQPNQGPAAARNRGIKQAKGKFFCFLDSDDRFLNQKLEITYRYIQEYPGHKVFHTEEIWYRKGNLLPQKGYHKKPSGKIFENAAKICCISISTSTIKKEVFKTVGLFDERMLVCEDYDFWLRVTAKFPVCLIGRYLTIKEGGHPDQQSKKYPAIDRFRIYALKKILEGATLNDQDYKIARAELKNKCSIYIKGAVKRGKTDEVNRYRKLISQFVKT